MSDSELSRWERWRSSARPTPLPLYTQAMISACPVPDPKTARSRKVLLLRGEPHKPACRLPLPPPLSVRNQRQMRKRRTAAYGGEAGPLRGLSPIRLRRVVRPCGARPAEHVEYETWPMHPLGYARSPSRTLVDPPPGELSFKRLQMALRDRPRGEDLV
jgi:hypothetical protein